MRLVFKFSKETRTGVSHFLLSWCITRHYLRKCKLLRQYGCALDLSDFVIGFKHLTYPRKLKLADSGVSHIVGGTPKQIVKRLHKMDAHETLVVTSAKAWTGWDVSIPSQQERKILEKMIGLPMRPLINVLHVRCGDKLSFGFEVDEETKSFG